MKMTGNTILVTGGTSGIGRALAEAFHHLGNHVVIASRRRDKLDEVVAACPGMEAVQLDQDDLASLTHLAKLMRTRFPELNVLVANAGISRAEDMTSGGWNTANAEAVVNTNILGPLRVTAAVLPVLKLQKHAAIVVTTSNLAFIPRADFPSYCASKAFLHSWLQSVRHQLRKIPVEVLELSPPYVATELTGPGQVSDPRAVPLDVYVAEVMRLLETGNHPGGEVLVERDYFRRTAERDGRYEEVFAAINPA